MKKTVMTLAAVWMMMGGAIACAQQPEKNTATGTATEQPAPATESAKQEKAGGECTGACEPKGDEKNSAQPEKTGTPAPETAASAE